MLIWLILIGIWVFSNVAYRYIDMDGLLRPKDERVPWATIGRMLAIQFSVVALVVAGIALLGIVR